MAQYRESYNSREITSDKKNGDKLTYRAQITHAASEAEAEDLALSEMPNIFSDKGLVRQSYSLKNMGAGVFNLEAEYAADDEPEQPPEGEGSETGQPGGEPTSQQNDDTPLGPEWTFNIAESSIHITQSLATLHTYGRPGIAVLPDYKKAIGVTTERIEGCDIIAPKETRSVTLRVAGMSNNYLKSVRKLFGHTNSQAMLGCEIGELLYVGFQAQYRAKELWSLTHNFCIAQNLEYDADNAEMVKRLTIGDIVLTNGKRAWSHLWVGYEPRLDATTGLTVEIPRYAFEEQVYPSGNLKLLGV